MTRFSGSSRTTLLVITVLAALTCGAIVWTMRQGPAIVAVDENTLREYSGVYQWTPQEFVYLQLWNELTSSNQLTAFDESGDVRTLYATGADTFFAGPGAAVSSSAEARIAFQREGGKVVSLTWQRDGAPARTAKRVDVERHSEIALSNGAVRLAGTLITPATREPATREPSTREPSTREPATREPGTREPGTREPANLRTREPGTKHPAVILVHGSGPANREFMLPFARFLVRRGMAVFSYDKRGVGQSTGDWQAASFEDLAGDVVAAFEHLERRPDIDASQIGLLGISQAGWVMPLAAVRAKKLAFLISISGPGVPASETTIDHAQHEMTGRGMRPQAVDQILALMKLQYEFARTGRGWDAYASARSALVARMGAAPPTFPGSPDDPYFASIRRFYFYDPAPTLRELRTPTLAIFGELDNNILANKNRAAWAAALEAGKHPDYTLEVLSRANHLQLEAKAGTNAEMPSLQRFVPAYFDTIRRWLARRVKGFNG